VNGENRKASFAPAQFTGTFQRQADRSRGAVIPDQISIVRQGGTTGSGILGSFLGQKQGKSLFRWGNISIPWDIAR
jgi:hypothetical protein